MDDGKTRRGDQAERLAGLLQIGLEAGVNGAGGSDEQKETLLRAVLAGTLPPDKEVVEALSAIADPSLSEGGSLGQALLDPATPLATLEKIKDHGKRLALAKRPETEHSAAIAVYFAAIASALLFREKRITSYSYGELAEHFGTLGGKRWMAPPLAGHFRRAREHCRTKIGSRPAGRCFRAE